MAIDTAEKQVSFLHFHSTSRNIPLPNGAYNQPDWQTLLGRYDGIAWSPAVVGGAGTRRQRQIKSLIRRRRR